MKIEITLISIHVLRAEDDPLCPALPGGARLFQSTSSVRRTTDLYPQYCRIINISIHVLRAEDDGYSGPR